jgi:phospholipase/carboxylesterase
MLHGRGADENDLLGLTPMLDERLLTISVRAPYPFSFGDGFTWFEIDDAGKPDQEMFLNSYKQLCKLTEDVLSHYPIDKRNLFLVGFSMGTMMSYSLSLTMPHLFRGVAAFSGYVPETNLEFHWNKLSKLDLFIAHGLFDPVIPVVLARMTREMFTSSNARWTYKEYPMEHEISPEAVADVSVWLRECLDRR